MDTPCKTSSPHITLWGLDGCSCAQKRPCSFLLGGDGPGEGEVVEDEGKRDFILEKSLLSRELKLRLAAYHQAHAWHFPKAVGTLHLCS